MERREAKRIRKPTKRYIEETSDVGSRESNGRLVSLVELGKRIAHQEVHYLILYPFLSLSYF